ncbi:MAG TPA: PAS domain-containing protein [Rhizomicrobium sp.]|nr:PAS domain-containing protein [Rhizomicrobium sp.]
METQALGFVLEHSPRRLPHLQHSIAEIGKTTNPQALSLIDAWKAANAGGGMVVGRDFPSRRFASLLPNILLLERLAGALDFRIRVAGFGMLCFYGFDPSGRRLSDFFDAEKLKARCETLNRVLSRNRPSLALSQLSHDGETFLKREVVSLPVLAFDTRTPLVLVASFWNRRWLN